MPSVRRVTGALLACGVLLAAAGCQSVPPLFGPQGNVDYQRRKATVFDPFADSDLGPEVVGGRPRDYQKAAPEVERSRWFRIDHAQRRSLGSDPRVGPAGPCGALVLREVRRLGRPGPLHCGRSLRVCGRSPDSASSPC